MTQKMLINTKSTQIVLIALAVLTTATITTTTANLKAADEVGCLKSTEGTCKECYQRKPLNGGCGPVTTGTNCQFYDADKCYMCAKGFALKYIKDFYHTECISAFIPNCFIAIDKPQTGLTCAACLGAYVSNDGKECVVPNSNNVKPIPNCHWSSYAKIGGKVKALCLRCELPYATSLAGDACVETPGLEGCLVYDAESKECEDCNVFEGYYADQSGKCVK